MGCRDLLSVCLDWRFHLSMKLYSVRCWRDFSAEFAAFTSTSLHMRIQRWSPLGFALGSDHFEFLVDLGFAIHRVISAFAQAFLLAARFQPDALHGASQSLVGNPWPVSRLASLSPRAVNFYFALCLTLRDSRRSCRIQSVFLRYRPLFHPYSCSVTWFGLWVCISLVAVLWASCLSGCSSFCSWLHWWIWLCLQLQIFRRYLLDQVHA